MLFHARTVICLSPLTRGIKGTMLVIGVARLVLGVRSLYLLFFPSIFIFFFLFFFRRRGGKCIDGRVCDEVD